MTAEKYADIPGAYPYTIAGREMWFKPPSQGQIVLFERFRMQLVGIQRMNDEDEAIRATIGLIAKALNVIDSLFLDSGDRDYVEMLISQDKLEITEITPLLAGGRTIAADDDDDAEPQPVKKTAGKANPSRAKR